MHQVLPNLLVIEEGDTIPADARLIEVVEMKTLEASLTGESVPVRKYTDPIVSAVALGDRNNMVFSGTAVAYGHGRAVVIGTGMNTELGRIAGLLEQAKTNRRRCKGNSAVRASGWVLQVIVIALIVVTTVLVVDGVFDPRSS